MNKEYVTPLKNEFKVNDVYIDGRPEIWVLAKHNVATGFDNRRDILGLSDACNHKRPKFQFARTAELYLSRLEETFRSHNVPQELMEMHFLRLGAEIYERMYGDGTAAVPKFEISFPLSPFAPDFADRVIQTAKAAPRALREAIVLNNLTTRLLGTYRDFLPTIEWDSEGTAGEFREDQQDILIMQQARPLRLDEQRMMILTLFESTLLHEWAHAFDICNFSQSPAFRDNVMVAIQALKKLPAPPEDECFRRGITRDFRLASTGEVVDVPMKIGNNDTGPGRCHNAEYYLTKAEGGVHDDLERVQMEVFAQSIALSYQSLYPMPSFTLTYPESMTMANDALSRADIVLSLPLDVESFIGPVRQKRKSAAIDRWNAVFPAPDPIKYSKTFELFQSPGG